jgi:hypothetical protein
MCTVNKVTHLFAHDAYNTVLDELPNHHWLWNSKLNEKFSTMTADLLANIANQSNLIPFTHNSLQITPSKKADPAFKAHKPPQSHPT